jgi:hypothetical protein
MNQGAEPPVFDRAAAIAAVCNSPGGLILPVPPDDAPELLIDLFPAVHREVEPSSGCDS